MLTRHRIKVQVPIPREIPPENVVTTLQTFEPLLDNNRRVVDYHAKPGPVSHMDLTTIQNDPFFRFDYDDLILDYTTPDAVTNDRWWLCDVWEDVDWVPFLTSCLSRPKRYLAVGCKTEAGIRFRLTEGGGVVTRGTFTVIARETGHPHASEAGGGKIQDGEAELGYVVSDVGDDGGRRGKNERETSRRGRAVDEKAAGCRDTRGGTDADSQPPWSLVCECEVESPLILSVPQFLRREANRSLCEHLCTSVLGEALRESDNYGAYLSNL